MNLTWLLWKLPPREKLSVGRYKMIDLIGRVQGSSLSINIHAIFYLASAYARSISSAAPSCERSDLYTSRLDWYHRTCLAAVRACPQTNNLPPNQFIFMSIFPICLRDSWSTYRSVSIAEPWQLRFCIRLSRYITTINMCTKQNLKLTPPPRAKSYSVYLHREINIDRGYHDNYTCTLSSSSITILRINFLCSRTISNATLYMINECLFSILRKVFTRRCVKLKFSVTHCRTR